MDAKQLNEVLQRLKEGEVIDFQTYKDKKQGIEPEQKENVFSIKSIVCTGAEGPIDEPWLEEKEYSLEEAQDRIYKADYILYKAKQDKLSLGGYDKCWLTVTCDVNGEEKEYYLRIDMGDHDSSISIVNELQGYIESEHKGEHFTFNGKTPVPDWNKYEDDYIKYAEKLKAYNADQERQHQDYLSSLRIPKAPTKGKTPKEVEVGDILVVDFGYSMILPTFFKVVKRTNASINVERLQNENITGSGFQGQCVPLDLPDKDTRYNKTYRITKKSWATDERNWPVCYIADHGAYYWNGKSQPYDHLD